MNKNFLACNLEQATVSVLRCELNKLTDCTVKGLSVGVSHIGGDSRHSVLTIHKVASDDSYHVLALKIRCNWDASTAELQFKQAIVCARKVISAHNQALAYHNTKHQAQLLPATQHNSPKTEHALLA